MKRYYRHIRFLLSFLLIYLIISRIDFAPLKIVLKDIRIQYIFMGFAIFLVHDLIKATKWNILLKLKDIRIGIIKLIQLDYASKFLALFLPSSISVDLFRAYGLSKEVASLSQAASSIIVDRVLSLLSLVVIANISLAAFYETVGNPQIAYITVTALIVMILGITALSNERIDTKLMKHENSLNRIGFLRKMITLRRSIMDYKKYRGKLLCVFSLSIIMQLFRIAIYYTASLAVNVEINYQYFVIFTPIVVLVSMLPISLAGIGLREGSFVYFYTKIGVSPHNAFAIAALVSLMVIFSSLPGGLVLAMKGLVVKKTDSLNRDDVFPAKDDI